MSQDQKQSEVEWHNDGHSVIILVDQSTVTVSLDHCPNGGREGTDCWHREANGCLVKHFIDLFGLEINKGMAPAALFHEISWAYLEGYDLYTSQVYIIPNEDESFSAWVEEQMGSIGEDGLEE